MRCPRSCNHREAIAGVVEQCTSQSPEDEHRSISRNSRYVQPTESFKKVITSISSSNAPPRIVTTSDSDNPCELMGVAEALWVGGSASAKCNGRGHCHCKAASDLPN
mmetsp:Transcript_97662/g.262439  ORF Transcript_97662/g.262439 Transcript_97662/m.262439 type:complete len:107 (+) Transcript_97662:212-532(+)